MAKACLVDLSDTSLNAADMSLIGKWINRHRLNFTAFTFDGAVVLDGAVAEYVGRVYDTIYAIRVDNMEYLLPAENVPLRELVRSMVNSMSPVKSLTLGEHIATNCPWHPDDRCPDCGWPTLKFGIRVRW